MSRRGRIASLATARANDGLNTTPRRSRTRPRCVDEVRLAGNPACVTVRPTCSRTWSTTTAGTSDNVKKYPSRWKHFNDNTRANACRSERVDSRAHDHSSAEGDSPINSPVDTTRRNRGYAVRSTDVTHTTPRHDEANRRHDASTLPDRHQAPTLTTSTPQPQRHLSGLSCSHP